MGAELFERLERSVLGVEAPITKLVATCRLISETQTFTLNDLARKAGGGFYTYTLTRSLLAEGLLRSASPSAYGHTDREGFSRALSELDSLLQANYLVAELEFSNRPAVFADGHRRLFASAYYLKRGDSLVSVQRVAARSVKVGRLVYHYIPTSEINDLVLEVENTCLVHHGLQKECSASTVSLTWFSREYLALFRELTPYSERPPRTDSSEQLYSGVLEPRELSHYVVEGEALMVIAERKERRRFSTLEVRLLLFQPSQADVGYHTVIRDALCVLGVKLGFESEAEAEFEWGRVDCVWIMSGEITHAFEVVVSGSFKEAFYRLGKLPTRVQKFIVADTVDERVRDMVEREGFGLLEADWVLAAAGSTQPSNPGGVS